MSNESLSILYVGHTIAGTTSLQRLRALDKIGHRVRPINSAYSRRGHRLLDTWNRLARRLFRMGLPHWRAVDIAGVNKAILEGMKQEPFDVLWLEKELVTRVTTLREVKKIQPRCRIVGYSLDDMAGRHNQSDDFLECLPLYDIFFTNKTYNVAELQALGCPRVHFMANAFDPDTHRPVSLTLAEKKMFGGPVGFVGHYEKDRAQSMRKVAEQGIPVRIYGGGWEAVKEPAGYLCLERRHIWGEDYAKVMCAFDINLGFLRRLNRDKQTTRSIEIPACGAFMLAERTDEHLDLFEEGVEAEFFASDDELLEKARYYLAHNERRERIAAAGRERCLKSGYSYPERLRTALQKVAQLQ